MHSNGLSYQTKSLEFLGIGVLMACDTRMFLTYFIVFFSMTQCLGDHQTYI